MKNNKFLNPYDEGRYIGSLLVENLLEEDKKQMIAIFIGRFHPFHMGHHSVYERLVEKFGADRVFIGTSNKKELPESPFSFEEKKLIMTTMFGIPEDRVVMIKSPYAPREILDRFDPDTPVVVAISEKDKDRFDGQKYYQELPEGDELEGYENTGYYIVAPEYQMELQNGQNVSGTAIRSIFGNPDASTKAKRRLFGQMYGRVNREIFELIVRRSLMAEKARVASEKDPKKKVTNPETGREIMVKNALRYAPDHPAYRAAKAEIAEEFGPLAKAYHPLFISTVGLIVGIQISEVLSERLDLLPEPLRKIAETEGVQDVIQLIRSNPNVQRIIKALEKLPKGKEHVIGLIRKLGKAILTNIDPKERRSLLSMSPGLEEMWVWNLPEVVAEPHHWTLTEEVMISRVLLTEYRRRVETNNAVSRHIIEEGGAHGHINHPFEDFQLTFGDLKRIVELGLEGRLDVEAPVTEKLDGQQISVTYIPNIGVVFARNKTHMAGKGVNALHVDSVAEMFAGRGDLTDAFTFAAADLEKAINKLTKAQKETLFGDGSKWVSVEIIFPATQNVIPYGHNLLVFHSTVEVDDNGNAIGIGAGSRDIQAMLKKINQDVQDTFTFKGSNVVTLPRAKKFSNRKGHYFGRIDKLQRQFRLTDNDPVVMWHHRWWESFIDSQARKHKYNMSPRVRGGLINRWAHLKTGAYTIKGMEKDIMRGGISFDTEQGVEVKNPRSEKFLAWVLDFDKTSKKNQFKENMAPFEAIFLDVGAEILQNARGLLSLSPDADSIRKDLDRAIAELSRTKDVTKLKRFREQLKKLEDVGMDKLVPTEGIVFMFGGKIYKLTGTFAPLNQLLGLLKY